MHYEQMALLSNEAVSFRESIGPQREQAEGCFDDY